MECVTMLVSAPVENAEGETLTFLSVSCMGHPVQEPACFKNHVRNKTPSSWQKSFCQVSDNS